MPDNGWQQSQGLLYTSTDAPVNFVGGDTYTSNPKGFDLNAWAGKNPFLVACLVLFIGYLLSKK